MKWGEGVDFRGLKPEPSAPVPHARHRNADMPRTMTLILTGRHGRVKARRKTNGPGDLRPPLASCQLAPAAAAYTSPLRTAHTAAWVRSVTPILRKMCWTCSFTVS